MVSASPPLALAPPDSTDRWRWLRALLILPLPLWLMMRSRRQGVISPLLDQLDPRIVDLLATIATGVLCHVLVNRLRTRHVPWPAAILMVVAPMMAAQFTAPATRWDLSAVISLALIVVALGGYLRFVTDAQTLGGFIAGITLALAAVCDLATLGYMAGFAAAVPFVAGPWAREVSATTAILAVLAYPSIAVYLGWLYIQWRFGDVVALDTTAPAAAAFDLARGALTAVEAAGHAPLYLAAGIAIARSRPATMPAYLMPMLVVALLSAGGVEDSPLVVNFFYTAVAVTAVQTRLDRRRWLLLTAVAMLQAGLALIWPP